MASLNTKYLAREIGAPLVAATIAKPTIAEPTEVLIRVKAIEINPADVKMVDQGHRTTSWPLVPGLNGAGIVEAVGNQVENVAVGDEVSALFTPGDRSASSQNFAVVQEAKVAKKLVTWSLEDAATIGYVESLVPVFRSCSRNFPLMPFWAKLISCDSERVI